MFYKTIIVLFITLVLSIFLIVFTSEQKHDVSVLLGLEGQVEMVALDEFNATYGVSSQEEWSNLKDNLNVIE